MSPRIARARAPVVLLLFAAASFAAACSKREGTQDTTTPIPPLGLDAAPSPSASIAEDAPRPGMVRVPAGTLRAGTPQERTPRIADEELPGTEISMNAFYIDIFPYPNEAGAIPTSNVSRDDAVRLCEAKGKRLCSELEWERACKGSDNTAYAYGDTYRADVCGTGVTPEQAAKRPSGDRIECKSSFGAREMHGGVWEWTDSAWHRGDRGSKPDSVSLGVLRGGNATAGELVGRCANAVARSPDTKSATMGFRCCAGVRNDPEVTLAVETGPVLTESSHPADVAAPYAAIAVGTWSTSDAGSAGWSFPRAWTWRPRGNEELTIIAGCNNAEHRCGLFVGKQINGAPKMLAQLGIGPKPPELAQNGEPWRLRARALDWRGTYSREIAYAYGRVDVGDQKRP